MYTTYPFRAALLPSCTFDNCTSSIVSATMSPIDRTSVAITYDGPRLVCLLIFLQKEIGCERDRRPSRSTMADVIIVPLLRRTHTDALADGARFLTALIH